MNDEFIELEQLNNEIIEKICSKQCGAKCCNILISNHYIPIEIPDYYRLFQIGLEHFITYFSTLEKPQLMRKPNGDCVFLHPKNKTCSIYKFRPQACRIYPFNYSNGDAPDFCILYHKSNKIIRNQQVEKGKEFLKADFSINISKKITAEYIKKEKNILVTKQFDFINQETIDRENMFFGISYTRSVPIEQIKQRIEEIQEKYCELKWYVYDLWVFGLDLNLEYRLEGVFRLNHDTDIPYLKEFPPTYKQYQTLYKLSLDSDELIDHVVAGVIIPKEGYEVIESKTS